MTRNEKSLQALFSSTGIIKSTKNWYVIVGEDDNHTDVNGHFRRFYWNGDKKQFSISLSDATRYDTKYEAKHELQYKIPSRYDSQFRYFSIEDGSLLKPQIYESRRPIKSGYAPYYNDSTISEKGKKAYEWLCDFVGQELKLGSHPWYGPCVYLNVNKMNITQDMLEEINNKMYEMDGYNSITADSGSWGYGDVYIVTFDQIRKE